jgi:hypothetical protein
MQKVLFISLSLSFLLFFYLGTGRNGRALGAAVLWMLLVSILAIQGFFSVTDTVPPRFAVIFIGNIICVLYLYRLLKNEVVDYQYSMIIHSLRILVEIALYILFLQGQVPKIMTFEGWNFDILVGISALILLLSFRINKSKPSKIVLLIWNYVSILFLINIVTIGILSAPLPIQQLSFEQPNIAVLKFPYILLPSLIVPIVFLTHILNIRQLTKKS